MWHPLVPFDWAYLEPDKTQCGGCESTDRIRVVACDRLGELNLVADVKVEAEIEVDSGHDSDEFLPSVL